MKQLKQLQFEICYELIIRCQVKLIKVQFLR